MESDLSSFLAISASIVSTVFVSTTFNLGCFVGIAHLLSGNGVECITSDTLNTVSREEVCYAHETSEVKCCAYKNSAYNAGGDCQKRRQVTLHCGARIDC